MNDTEKKIITQMIDELILKAVPKAQTVAKYGGVLYTTKPDEKEGQFCGTFTFKNHVQLSFANGAELTDPTQVLQGNGKYRRHINFLSPDDIDSKVLLALIKQSEKLK